MVTQLELSEKALLFGEALKENKQQQRFFRENKHVNYYTQNLEIVVNNKSYLSAKPLIPEPLMYKEIGLLKSGAASSSANLYADIYR